MEREEIIKRNEAMIDALERMIAITVNVLGEERCENDVLIIKQRAELAAHLKMRGWLE
jgi:hypothetical protein